MPEGAHLAVRKTCILLLGELCEWIERHSECLESCLQFLIRALHDKQLAYAAATALQVRYCNVLQKVYEDIENLLRFFPKQSQNRRKILIHVTIINPLYAGEVD